MDQFYTGLGDNFILSSNFRLKRKIESYSFFHVLDKFDFENKQISENFKKSKIIIINHCNESQTNEQYFIIGFRKTIISINIKSIYLLFPFFTVSTKPICFIPGTKAKFDEKIPKKYNEIEYDLIFKEEIWNLNQFYELQTSKLRNYEIWKSIQTCISGYLIKESYFNLKQNRMNDIEDKEFIKTTINTIKPNEYIEIRTIGTGTHFTVTLILIIEKEILCALKKPLYNNLEIDKLIKREYENYQQISFPLFPQLYGIVEGKNYLIIEFINGIPLSNISEMKLNNDEILSIIFEIILMITFLHQKKYIYRDLKPNNIMIDLNKSAVLIDFDRLIKYDSIASNENVKTNDFSSKFASPEINTDKLSYKSDIYSIGMIIRYIMTNNETLKEENFKENHPKLYHHYENCINSDLDKRITTSNLFKKFFSYYQLYINNFEIISRNNKNLIKLILNGYIVNEEMETIINKFGHYYIQQKDTNNKNKIFHYFSISSELKSSEGQLFLGIMYLKEIPRNLNKAIQYLTLSAEQNNTHAQFILGSFYIENGNINKGINYLTLSANQNNSSAQISLGILFLDNKYIPCNINQSIHYLTLSANQNNPKAQLILGILFLDNKYILCDINKSIYYLTLSANQNNSDAQLILGLLFFENKYIPCDIKKSIHYLTLSANQNNPGAHYMLGIIYCLGEYIERNINKSLHYFSFAANLNDQKAQFMLGFIYFSGKYIQRDINKSIHYFSLAANQNDPHAQYYLGYIYYLGKYIPKNIKKGHYYIIQSSKNGNIEGNFSHGFLLHEGKYIERNIKEAIHYYKEASSFYDKNAKNNLGIIYKNGFGDEIEERLGNAIEYFEEAIHQRNDFLSMYNLAHVYIYNESIKLKDINKPIELLVKSSNKFNASLFLLCLVLIKRFGSEMTKIEQEIKKFVDTKSNIISKIKGIIYYNNLFDKSIFDSKYEQFKKIDFLYNIELQPIISSSLKNIKTELNFSKYPNAKNISSEFYEGFSIF